MSPVDHLPPRAVWTRKGSATVLELSGDWHRDGPAAEESESTPGHYPDRYQTDALGSYDSTLPAFLLAWLRTVADASADKDKRQAPALDGLPDNLRGLLELALAVPEESQTATTTHPSSDVRNLGKFTLRIWDAVCILVDFIGQSVLSLGRLATGRARFRAADFWQTLEECGAQALPIVSLISFLIGVILAFVGNVQLANFGANLFVADLVGIAMVREMGVVMTAIIMSGRTGAAFAAHLGSMKANEEIDALRTFGFDPFDFLVLPRLLALVLMMPILTVYAMVFVPDMGCISGLKRVPNLAPRAGPPPWGLYPLVLLFVHPPITQADTAMAKRKRCSQSWQPYLTDVRHSGRCRTRAHHRLWRFPPRAWPG